jgi:nonribosomal peptide synthetase MxcG
VANRLGVPVATVFANPTVAALAAALDGSAQEASGYRADAVLPPDIVPRPGPVTGRVLLTGATGFVGSHLLVELLAATDAQVVCVVRGEEARERLRAALTARTLAADLGRVEIVPEFTTPVAVDAVYHAAAVVSVLRGYPSMRAINVGATLDLLRRGVPFHHVSTLAVATTAGYVDAHPGLRDGYQQSKWVAERLVQQAAERGLPAAVYRLGRVVGAPGSAFVNPDDLVWRILRAGLPCGVLPDLAVAEPWTPVDYVARSIVALSRGGATGVHNLAPAPPVRFADVTGWVRDYGYDVTVLPVPAWTEAVRAAASDADAATLAFFDGAETPPVPGDQLDSADSGVPCPPIDRALMHRYLDYAVAHGVLPDPVRNRGIRE